MSRVAARWGLAAETVHQLDKRVLRRWAAGRPRKPLRYLGVDELFVGREVQFPVVSCWRALDPWIPSRELRSSEFAGFATTSFTVSRCRIPPT